MLLKLLLKRIYYNFNHHFVVIYNPIILFMVGLLWSFCLWLNILRAILR